MAVISALLLFSTIEAQAGERVSLKQMKAQFSQHKQDHKQKVKTRQETFKAKKEAREAVMAERQRVYEEQRAMEAAAAQGGYIQPEVIGTTETNNTIGDEQIDIRSADEIQAEIEESLRELRKNVDQLQNQVDQETSTPSNSDTSDSSAQ